MKEKKVIRTVRMYAPCEKRLVEAYEEYGQYGRWTMPGFMNVLISLGLDVIDVKRGITPRCPNSAGIDLSAIYLAAGIRAPASDIGEALKRMAQKPDTGVKATVIPFRKTEAAGGPDLNTRR
jgi:hypothetical protein